MDANQFRLVVFAILCIISFFIYGWSQNGRYQSSGVLSYIDTRTGKINQYGSDKRDMKSIEVIHELGDEIETIKLEKE